MKRILLGAVALAVLIAGCSAAARLKVLQPTALPSSPIISLPSAPARLPAFQRGIDIDAYTYPGQDIAAVASADVAYIKGLHANAVSISFPFFMTGPVSPTVFSKPSTPTPGQLAALVQDAEQAGLYVSLRPLLDESSLGSSRVYWAPPDPSAWFASYRHFLLPYAAMAQREHAQEFIAGAEFSMFGQSPHWNALDRALGRRFHGTLGCANNWGPVAFLGDGSGTAFAGNCGHGMRESADAYHPQYGNLLTGWEAFDRRLPQGTVETEVGIDAVVGANKRPYQHEWTKATAIDTSVQAQWFTAACHAAVKEHLGGIYFWSLGFGQQLTTGPTLKNQGAWAGSAGATAISQCFKTLRGVGK